MTAGIDKGIPGYEARVLCGSYLCSSLRGLEGKLMVNWSQESILVTGGTGSFGKKFVEIMLRDYHPQRLVIFSRDELKQHEMRTSGFDHASMRYFIGDVRDVER